MQEKKSILAPSILAADFNILGSQIEQVEKSGAEYLHIDVMDGAFVPSISFGMPVISSIRKNSKLVFDVHLMINEPSRYLSDFKNSGADIITVHAEACTHLNRTVSEIKEAGVKVGVALNPSTPIEVLEYVLKDIDMVLIMSVNPGFGGQNFIESTYRKLADMQKMCERLGCSPDLEVDGGVTLSNVRQIIKAGANVIVSGSSVFRGDISANVRAFREEFEYASR